MSYLDDNGHEVLDSTPIAVPVKFRGISHEDTIRQIIRQELSRAAQEDGDESFEEADDFDVGDDYDPMSPWELTADQELFSLADQRVSGPPEPVSQQRATEGDPVKAEDSSD